MRNARLRAKQATIAATVLVLAALIIWLPANPGTVTPAITERHETLVNTSFTMPSETTNYYVAYAFVVPTGLLEATVQGNFTAHQSGDEGAEFFVMSAPQFTAFQANGTTNLTALYDSGPLAGSSFSASLFAPGPYYLVFAEEPVSPGHTTPILAAGVTVRAEADLIYSACRVC